VIRSLPRRRPAVRVTVGGFVLALLASACVHPQDPGVHIATIQSSIVFGVQPKKDAAVPPGVIPEEDDLPEQPEQPDEVAAKPKLPPLPNVQLACPKAREDAFLEKIAGSTLSGQPQEGYYLWKQAGKVSLLDQLIDFNQYGYRYIFDVSPVTTTHLPGGDPVDPTKPADLTEFTYKVRRPDLLRDPSGFGAFYIDTFKVRQSPLAVSQYPPDQPSQLPVTAVAGGDPERGVSLIRSERYSGRSTSPVSVFAPQPGVLLMPLPVVTGQAFEGAGVDPESGATMAVRGVVGGRKEVDACGSIVQGWEMPATVTMASGNNTQSQTNYTYYVAPQYGGMFIYERLEPSGSISVGGPEPQTYSLGSLHPVGGQ
jgi:hypothetical protein